MPELVVIGHVTRDLDANEERVGGAASYAALAAAELGIETLLLTCAPPEAPLLARLEHPLIQLYVQPCRQQTTFELVYSGAERRLWVKGTAEPLSDETLRLARAPLAYVGPVMGEVGPERLGCLSSERLVLGVQGWLRALDSKGEVHSAFPDALWRLPLDAELVLSEHDHPDADLLAQRLSANRRAVVVTRGARGVTLWSGARPEHFAAPNAVSRDPTGAGDVFGVVFALRRARGDDLRRAVERAQLAAAASTEGALLGNLAAVKHQVMP